MIPDDISLVMTCGACPEQYDAMYNGKIVGYLRLRHGHFRVDYPECGGETVYTACPQGDGIFEHHERDRYLNAAKLAIFLKMTESEEEGLYKIIEQAIITWSNDGNQTAGLLTRDIIEIIKSKIP